MYSEVFCKVYNEFGWNYYPEAFGEQLLLWMEQHHFHPKSSMDLACGTGILCQILKANGIAASGMDYSQGMIDIARGNDPEIPYDVADMTVYRPNRQFDLVTCTGDAINHIAALSDVESIFRNVYHYLSSDGYFVFDLLNEKEVSDSEPFEMDFSDSTRVWFQMTKPTENSVNLKIKVFENSVLAFEENIRETIHDPAAICQLLQDCGFIITKCADHLPDNANQHGTTWFLIAQKQRNRQ